MSVKAVSLIAPKWTSKKLGNCGVFKYFEPIRTKNLTMEMEVFPEMQLINLYKDDSHIGRRMFSFGDDAITEIDVEIFNPENRKQGLGKLFQSLSGMLMKENNAKAMQCYSAVPSAIQYHVNQGFKPVFNNKDTALSSLDKVTRNTGEKFAELAQEAKELLKKSYSKDGFSGTNDFLNTTGEFFERYIDMLNKNKIKCTDISFPLGMDIRMTTGELVKNKEAYNEILRKEGINYCI